ncbi:MAG TPA: hypothetical protein VGO91_18270 [Pyrinomonadaceae bacterium]|nr:hypothetical protein [Pyrinomonadaceae bacterium]
MRLSFGKKVTVLLATLVLIMMATNRVSTATPPLPNPVLLFIGQEDYDANGKHWTRYKYTVDNLANYPNELFAPAPDLPPCGQNTKSSRTWVDIYDSRGKRLYGFCALANHDGLGQLWFALESDVIPPSWIYIEMNDRKTTTKYKSNLAETTG